jgi:pimeloyl-ACP methyl ester carboxylesterase
VRGCRPTANLRRELARLRRRREVGDAALQTTVPESVSDERITVAGLGLRVLQKGSGSPLVVLHDSLGNLGWLPLYEELAGTFAVCVPDLPGYGKSDRPDWARSPRDIAVLVEQLLDKLGLTGITLVGMGFGGFIGAELATMHQSRIARMVLVGATGLRPRTGEIADQVFLGFPEYGISGFRDADSFRTYFGVDSVPDDLYELWDLSTEMTARICWTPWMFSDQLPHLIAEVRIPTLLVWGEHEHLVPLDIAHQYASLMPNARLEMVADAGHVVDLEQPDELAKLIRGHAATSQGGRP